jgi:predicted flap endonuclease-1-like 5' DNA nuclease
LRCWREQLRYRSARGKCCDREITEAVVTNIEEIEGIGPVFGAKLQAAGVKTVEALLTAGGSPAGRKDLATKTELDASRILEWVNRADLMRINGVGSEFSDLLEASGVDTVKELATRNAANLHTKMLEVNEAKKLVRRAPTAAEVEKWVAEAKTLPSAVSY